jgi:hypothetical protein
MGGLSATGSGQTLACLSKVKPTSRWTGDGISYLSSPLNSLSIIRIEYSAHSNQKLARTRSTIRPQTKGSAHAISATQPGPGGYPARFKGTKRRVPSSSSTNFGMESQFSTHLAAQIAGEMIEDSGKIGFLRHWILDHLARSESGVAGKSDRNVRNFTRLFSTKPHGASAAPCGVFTRSTGWYARPACRRHGLYRAS